MSPRGITFSNANDLPSDSRMGTQAGQAEVLAELMQRQIQAIDRVAAAIKSLETTISSYRRSGLLD